MEEFILMDDDIKYKIKKELSDAFIDSQLSYYQLIQNIENSNEVSFETNETSLRRTLKLNDNTLNLDAMLALCQYFKIDINSILNISPVQEKTAIATDIVCKQKLFHIFISINEQVSKGTLRFLNNEKVSLIIDYRMTYSQRVPISREFYVGKYTKIENTDTYFLHLKKTKIKDKHYMFTYLEADTICVVLSMKNINEHDYHKGFLYRVIDEVLITLPIFFSSSEILDIPTASVYHKLSINESKIIITGSSIKEVISFLSQILESEPKYIKHRCELSPSIPLEQAIGCYLAHTEQFYTSSLFPLSDIDLDTIYILDDEAILDRINDDYSNEFCCIALKRLRGYSVRLKDLKNYLDISYTL